MEGGGGGKRGDMDIDGMEGIRIHRELMAGGEFSFVSVFPFSFSFTCVFPFAIAIVLHYDFDCMAQKLKQ